MVLELERKYKKEQYTIGDLSIDGVFFCNTIEDKDRGLRQTMTEQQVRKLKVYGKTAIPCGTYLVQLTYSPRFQRTLPLVVNVKGYDGIRIHSGNTADDSLGCIIVGENKLKGRVINSRQTLESLMIELKARAKRETITLIIK